MVKNNALFLVLLFLALTHTLRPFAEPEQRGRSLLRAQRLKDQTQFNSILTQAMQSYRNNKAAFDTFINTRDGYGSTVLVRAAALNDITQIVFILERLKQYYNTSTQDLLAVFNFINAQNLQGHTAFYLIVQNAPRKIIELMMYHIIDLIGDQKQLFFRFLTPNAYNDKWTPLHWLAYQGALVNLTTVIAIAERILGKDSNEFESFINAENAYGETPLSEAYFNVRHKKELVEHGGIIIHQTPPDVEQARQIGLELIESIREDRFSAVQKIIATTQEQYKDNPHLFLEMLTVRSHNGWDPLMHASALSYEYTAFLLHVMERFFQNDEESIYTILRNVAQDGRGALCITILRRNFDISKLLIKKIMDYAPNKFYLYMLMNISIYGKGFTPLLAAVNFSSDQDEFFNIIERLIKTIESVFGKDSRAVYLYVNTEDLDGFTPLEYATSPKVTEILLHHGAKKHDELKNGFR